MTSFPLRQDARMAALVDAVACAETALDEFHEALRHVNDEGLNDSFRPVKDIATKILASHQECPGPTIAGDIAHLRSMFGRVIAPREDPDLGRVPSLKALRAARGNLLSEFDDVLDSARALGWRPTDPNFSQFTPVEMPRENFEGMVHALIGRMNEIERLLRDYIEPESRPNEGRTKLQIGLVRGYLSAMRTELSLAQFEARMRATIDLVSLARAVTSISELTLDFVATVQGVASKVTKKLRSAADALQNKVGKVVTGFRTMLVGVERRQRKSFSTQPKSTELPTHEQPFVRRPQGEAVPDLVEQFFKNLDQENENNFMLPDTGIIINPKQGDTILDRFLQEIGKDSAALPVLRDRFIDRLPVVLAIDVSGSTGQTGDINQINNFLKYFAHAVAEPSNDVWANIQRHLDLCIISYSDIAEEVLPWTSGDEIARITSFTLVGEGTTSMGAGLELCASAMLRRLGEYRVQQIPSYCGFIFNLTDGSPTDMSPGDPRWHRVKKMLDQFETIGSFGHPYVKTFHCASRAADRGLLRELAYMPDRVIDLEQADFEKFFEFIRISLSMVISDDPY